eukprot:GDKJ01009247.1.p1 GENE.GDKJ01009247.1~~GDKJ01009247.1.p1  ORF type:complete len:145 (+),score=41.56 GDKJ01009247.1:1-435(+)
MGDDGNTSEFMKMHAKSLKSAKMLLSTTTEEERNGSLLFSDGSGFHTLTAGPAPLTSLSDGLLSSDYLNNSSSVACINNSSSHNDNAALLREPWHPALALSLRPSSISTSSTGSSEEEGEQFATFPPSLLPSPSYFRHFCCFLE